MASEFKIDWENTLKEALSNALVKAAEQSKKDFVVGLCQAFGVTPEPKVIIKKVRVCSCCGSELEGSGHRH